ncbi:MAG: hypothetical protein IKM53_02655 [Clostridia bacterium]|nr:hypothetical protein [Clostridia bacterium]
MIEQDTIKLLRECDAGVKMGVSSIEDVIDRVKHKPFKERLECSKNEHWQIKGEIQNLLTQYKDDGKDPNPIAKGMSWMKTNLKVAADDSDKVIADLITDGCNMGVKSLNRYLNQYCAADEKSKSIAKRLIGLEDDLAKDISVYL